MNRHRVSEVGVIARIELVDGQAILQVETGCAEREDDEHLKCANPQHPTDASRLSNHRLVCFFFLPSQYLIA